MSLQAAPPNLSVYYDGLCQLCSREIDMYRSKDKSNRIHYVDISSAGFDASKENLDPDEVQKVFHVKNKEGKIITGVDGFIAIWDQLEIFRPLSALAKQKFVRPIFDLGYYGFAKMRPFLPRKKCDTGNCKI